MMKLYDDFIRLITRWSALMLPEERQLEQWVLNETVGISITTFDLFLQNSEFSLASNFNMNLKVIEVTQMIYGIPKVKSAIFIGQKTSSFEDWKIKDFDQMLFWMYLCGWDYTWISEPSKTACLFRFTAPKQPMARLNSTDWIDCFNWAIFFYQFQNWMQKWHFNWKF